MGTKYCESCGELFTGIPCVQRTGRKSYRLICKECLERDRPHPPKNIEPRIERIEKLLGLIPTPSEILNLKK